MNKQEKWDRYFLDLAREISKKSKDPSTKVGAVITDKNNRLISTGYNGLPQGVIDSPERLNDRDTKLLCIIHAEMNAILFSTEKLTDCTVYTFPFAPCSNCASALIQKGVKRAVFPKGDAATLERWKKSLTLGRELMSEAGVEMVEICL